MANQKYDNFVLENRLESILSTKLDFNQFVSPDYSLTENAGMIKKIHKYQATGAVEDLAMGVGNSGDFESTFTEESYTVGVTQGRGKWYDEEEMADPMVVDTIVKGMAEGMVNDFTAKAIAEMKKASQIVECDFSTNTSNYFFNKVVDALALIDADLEDESGFSIIVSPANQAYIRKQLGDNLKYVEDYVRTGYIGHVAGVPVVMSKACPDSCAFLENRNAITLFVKKGSEAEQERDADTRQNKVWIRKVALVALTNDSYLVELAKAQETACAITTYLKTGKTIAGTCGSDCDKVIVNYDGVDYSVIPSAGAWTIDMAANLTAGKKINAKAIKYGFAPKVATEVTVAS